MGTPPVPARDAARRLHLAARRLAALDLAERGLKRRPDDPVCLAWRADPAQRKPGEINAHDGGRGLYFEDPNGHLIEIITRPYGSGGWNL